MGKQKKQVIRTISTTVVVFIFCINSFKGICQNKINTFFQLGKPEKQWVICHPFIASKAYRITKEVQFITNSLPKDSILDSDTDGGSRDAFKHAFWMICLSKEIPWKKALRLGNAHEASNIRDFKNRKPEDGALPDSANSTMDMLNNHIGIDIVKQYPNLSQAEYINVLKLHISQGKLWVLYKDSKGNFLDCTGKIVADSISGIIWNAPKCLIPSNLITKSVSE